MNLHPPDSEQKLGFHLVRRKLEGFAQSDPGRERIAAIGPLVGRPDVERLLAQTSELQQAIDQGDALPAASFPDVREALRKAQPKDAVLDGPDLAEVMTLLQAHRQVVQHFRSRRDAFPTVASLTLQQDPQSDLEQHIGRVIDRRGNVRDDASPELRRIKRALADVQAGLEAALNRALRAAAREGFAAEEQPTIRSGRAVIPVRAEAKRKVQGFIHDVSGSGQTVYIEPAEVLDLNNEVRELELEQAREVRHLLQQLTQHLRSGLPQVRGAIGVMAEFDELQARARLSHLLDAVVPELNEEGRIHIVRGRNPALVLHFREMANGEGESGALREVVPLDIELSDEIATVVITGPNAGGKSVALKTTGLLCLMVSCGLPVAAAPETSLPLLEKICVDIGDQQSIENDLSTFTSHVANLREMLEIADSRTLVLIDEAGTGTDPAEGGALAQAVLADLTARGARTVVTTHHGTLKAFAHETPRVMNASMEFDRATLAPTYRFRAGMPGSSYAFEIADRVGLSPQVLAQARRLVGEGKTAVEELIAALDARSRELEVRLEAAELELRRAEQARRSFEGRDRALKERREQILAEATANASQLVAEANARVERTIREIKEAGAERERTLRAREELAQFADTVEKEQEALRRRAHRRDAPTAERPPGPLTVGDQVRLEENGATAEILELDGEEAVVAVGQMRLRVSADRLVRVGGRPPQRTEVRLPAATQAALPILETQRRLDLRGQRVEDAVREVERLIDRAAAAGVTSVEILHGKGTGALREAIRAYLDSRPEVSAIEDAAWNEGGHGVTVVSL